MKCSVQSTPYPSQCDGVEQYNGRTEPRIFTGGDFLTGCDVIWKKEGVWPNANAGAFNHGGSLQISDYFSFSPDVDQRLGNNKIDFAMTLTHESMHYIYGLSDQYYENKVERNECVDISADVQNNLINVLFKCDKTDAKYSGGYAHLKKSTNLLCQKCFCYVQS